MLEKDLVEDSKNQIVMPTEEQIRQLNIDSHEAAQLQRLEATDTFQPTRSPPPIPIDHARYEEVSRFSDSEDNAPDLERAFSFAQGSSKRHRRGRKASLNGLRILPSTDIIQHISEEPEDGEPKPKVSRSVSAAAAKAVAASERSKTSRMHRFWQSPSTHGEDTAFEIDDRYEEMKLRGLVPPWKLLRENRKKSREGKFLSAGTLRKSKQDEREPKRSNTVADPEAAHAKRERAIFFTD